MSKPSAPEAKAPAYEDDLVRIAGQKRGKASAIQDQIGDLDQRQANADRTSLLRRMAHNSNAASTGQAVASSDSTMGRVASIITGSGTEGRALSGANKNADLDKLSRRSNLLNARMGSTRMSTNNLMDVSKSQQAANLSQLNADVNKMNQRYGAVGSIVGTAAGYGADKEAAGEHKALMARLGET